jgi:ABC-2 type transport system permease protein
MTATLESTSLDVASTTGPGFGAAVRSEWSKFWTAKSPRRNLVLGTLLGIGLSVLIAVVTGVTFDEWPAEERATFDPVMYPLSGTLLVAIFYVAVGVNVGASEYASGMIRLTFTATPKRERILAAKALVVVATTTVAGIIATGGMFGISQLVYGANDLPTASISDGGLWRTMLAMALLGWLFPVIGVALAFVLRSTAGAITATLALVFAPSMFGSLLPAWWRENIISLLPGPASDSLALGHLDDSDMYLPPAAALAVIVVWLAVAWFGTRWLVNRRDA